MTIHKTVGTSCRRWRVPSCPPAYVAPVIRCDRCLASYRTTVLWRGGCLAAYLTDWQAGTCCSMFFKLLPQLHRERHLVFCKPHCQTHTLPPPHNTIKKTQQTPVDRTLSMALRTNCNKDNGTHWNIILKIQNEEKPDNVISGISVWLPEHQWERYQIPWNSLQRRQILVHFFLSASHLWCPVPFVCRSKVSRNNQHINKTYTGHTAHNYTE